MRQGSWFEEAMIEEVKLSRVHQKEFCYWLPFVEGRFWQSCALNSVSRGFPAALKLKCSRVSEDNVIGSRADLLSPSSEGSS